MTPTEAGSPNGPAEVALPDEPDPDGERLHPLTPVFRGGGLALIVMVAVVRDQLNDLRLGVIGIALATVVVVGGAYGFATWFFTRYRLTDDSLRINTGPIVRRHRVLRYDRLQAVDVNQPFLARLFGLAELRMDVAGGSKAEGKLGYFRLGEAQALRARLLARAAGLHADTPTAPEHVVLTVPTGRVVGATLISTPVVGAFLGALVVVALTMAFDQPIGLLVLIPWVVGVLTPIYRNITRLGGFTLSSSPDGLRVRHGLTGVEHQTLPPGRIQGLAITQSLLWRLLGWYRVEVDVAGMGGQDRGDTSSAVVLPVGDLTHMALVVERLFGSIDPLQISRHRAPGRARWLRPVGTSFLSWGCDETVFVSAKGWIDRRIDVVPHAKTQSVRITQGPVQRRLRLATVHVDTPVGPVNAAALHRDTAEASWLARSQIERAHLLRSRSSGDQWMRVPPAAPSRGGKGAGSA